MSFPSGYDLNDTKVQKTEAILLRTLGMNVAAFSNIKQKEKCGK